MLARSHASPSPILLPPDPTRRPPQSSSSEPRLLPPKRRRTPVPVAGKLGHDLPVNQFWKWKRRWIGEMNGGVSFD
ncbi:unnamed protein product [Prunus armeniaca]|uniref:Uncharacterized protein n=1 Tax=Prunus armeniaca TaxID=36596 RepID=A0A6J5U1U2_PRUAR|nr:hypothetical protein GBA52_006679 [Prunus armeniaca]CAB4269992.1 unnamed protein product [Prunus armeniaca]CAB4300417.1 unnamed protein product [Prunus armeniaca]